MYPRLIEIGPYQIPKIWMFGPYTLDFVLHTYGALLALAFIVAIIVVVRGAKRDGVPHEKVFDLAVYTVISALIGAKLLLIITDLPLLLRDPTQIFSTVRAGGVFYGGFLFATVVSILYLRRYNLPVWKVADLVAPGIAIGQAIGRLGCLAAGCCYGKPTQLPWGIRFTDIYVFETTGTPIDLPVHPTQIYESLATFALFLLLVVARRWKSFDGQLFWIYAAAYSVIRFVIELFRNDPRGFVLGLVSTSQFIAAILLPTSILVYFFLKARSVSAARSVAE